MTNSASNTATTLCCRSATATPKVTKATVKARNDDDSSKYAATHTGNVSTALSKQNPMASTADIHIDTRGNA